MLSRPYFFVGIFAGFLATASWSAETVTYVRKVSTDNFLGWGQLGFYFPQFNAPDSTGPERTDDNMQFHLPSWLAFQFDERDGMRTFSIDAGPFDWDLPDPPKGLGVYTRGGYSHWAHWTLPNGFYGRSGTVVDEAAADNSNNTVNRIQIKNGVPSSFCMHIVTDNTANEHDSAREITVRGGRDGEGDFDPNDTIPGLSFDGMTDVYTFRFDNFSPDDFIKIRLHSGSESMAPGFGGLMFDLACDYIPNADCGNGACNQHLAETCESCPEDCGACIPGQVTMGNWVYGGTSPHSHPKENGSDRLLVFAAHGVDNEKHHVQGVTYGNKIMYKLAERSQDNNERASISLWYLKEADIYTASHTQFSVNWSNKPGDRHYESVFLFGVSQQKPFGSVDTGGENNSSSVACASSTVETGHMSLYAATHVRQGNFFALNGFSQDNQFYLGSNGQGSCGRKGGSGIRESAAVAHTRSDALVIGCAEVQDLPRTRYVLHTIVPLLQLLLLDE